MQLIVLPAITVKQSLQNKKTIYTLFLGFLLYTTKILYILFFSINNTFVMLSPFKQIQNKVFDKPRLIAK